jgi:diguanylate cyclase (GGDEF)-like protein
MMHETMNRPITELAAMRRAFELVREPVFVIDALSGRIIEANPAACDSAGIGRGDLVGRLWRRTLRRSSETTLCDVDGRWFVAIDHLPAAEATDGRRTHRDPLTGLATRDALSAMILTGNAAKSFLQFAVLFVDLDGFKQINDTCGHITGDLVLKTVAQRLAASVRRSDLVLRYGGDEFLVVIQSVSRRRDLNRLRRRISRAVQRPIVAAGYQIVVYASIGIAEQTSTAASLDELISAADHDMYRMKANRQTASRSSPVASNGHGDPATEM